MNQKQFLEKLQQLSEYTYINDADTKSKRSSKAQQVRTEPDQDHNFGPVITRFKTNRCSDCDRECDQTRVIQHSLVQGRAKFWKTRCMACGRYRHPKDGLYRVAPNGSSTVYIHYYQKLENQQNID